MKYNIIYADPPWHFRCGNAPWSSKGAESHYEVMTHEDLIRLKVSDLAAPDCALFMWATGPMLEESFSVMQAWGFQYKTMAFVWVKTCQDGRPLESGLGYWTRSGVEYCLLGLRGKMDRVGRSVPQIVMAPRTEHSEKPHVVRERIVKLMGDLPKVELFSRHVVDGWDRHGSDIGDIRDMLPPSRVRKVHYKCDTCGYEFKFISQEGVEFFCPECNRPYDLGDVPYDV